VEFHAALAEVAEASTRVYYDAAIDPGDADLYYAGVELDQLAELVIGTHRARPRYQLATELYPWSICSPTGRCAAFIPGSAMTRPS
jgi:hypothetical protein